MQYAPQHQGKWVAAKDEDVIDFDDRLAPLMMRVKKRSDWKKVSYGLVPKGIMIGRLCILNTTNI